ncbi:proton-coupled amino acid transporter 3 [Toxorhynchites rutilus septentrionalis]|uniref:proton-coupled amino acid transporter 3 n=1 Tax=Toxorhynchites rutilus septentrionalis TaxID=329112 RepID=UPI00247865C7|nr:proton-coupled amino acid transporter 3 [Toxorhynchites rutilus septentrionalis]
MVICDQEELERIIFPGCASPDVQDQRRARIILADTEKPTMDHTGTNTKLSLFFASLCIIDLFGVFPIVALPKSIISCGLYGIPLVLLVITLQIYTATVLGKCWTIAEKLDPSIVSKNRYPYAAIAEFTFGKRMSWFVTVLLDLTVFGGGIPNLLVAAQNLQLLGSRITGGQFELSFCYWLLLLGVFLCPIMWLGSPKNMRALASVSVTVCSSVALLAWYSIGRDVVSSKGFEPFKGIKLGLPSWIMLLKAYGIIAFQFDIHPMLLTIQVDMEKKRQIGKAVFLGLMATCTLSAVTTLLAAYRYGMDATNNILQVLPHSWSLFFTILLVTLQLCLSSAVGSSALFQHIEDVLGASRDFTIKRCMIRSVLVWLAVMIAELLPRFDVVMGTIGGTLTGPLIFILPPLLYQKMIKMEAIYYQEMGQLQSRDAANCDSQELLFQGTYGSIGSSISVYSRPPKLHRLKRWTLIFCERWKQFVQFMYSDCILSVAVITFGIAATLVSTYYNMFDVKTIGKQFWGTCIGNISLVSDL